MQETEQSPVQKERTRPIIHFSSIICLIKAVFLLCIKKPSLLPTKADNYIRQQGQLYDVYPILLHSTWLIGGEFVLHSFYTLRGGHIKFNAAQLAGRRNWPLPFLLLSRTSPLAGAHLVPAKRCWFLLPFELTESTRVENVQSMAFSVYSSACLRRTVTEAAIKYPPSPWPGLTHLAAEMFVDKVWYSDTSLPFSHLIQWMPSAIQNKRAVFHAASLMRTLSCALAFAPRRKSVPVMASVWRGWTQS